MFFSNNKPEKPLTKEEISKNRLFKFFDETNKDELQEFSDQVSLEAKQLFDGSVQGLLGQMPDDVAITNLTINKESLKNLLFSSMMTGYLTKALENKMDLDKCWESGKSESDNLIEKQLKEITGDDELKGIL